MKKITFGLVVFLFSISSFAQDFEEEYIINSGTSIASEVEENYFKLQEDNKLNYNFNVGTSFSTWKGGSIFSTYVNPNLNYRFTPKFSVSTGVVVSNNTLLSNYYTANGEKANTNFVDSYLQVSGMYQVNEKLQVAGTVMYHSNNFSPQMNANAFDNLDYSVSAKYKLTKNIELGVEFSTRNRNPYMQNRQNPIFDDNE